jgi:hypothetical protein
MCSKMFKDNLVDEDKVREVDRRLKSLYPPTRLGNKDDPLDELIFNPSCYHKKLMEAARTNRATLSSKPRAVTA